MLGRAKYCIKNTLSNDAIEQWKNYGFVLVRNILNREDVYRAYNFLLEQYPNNMKYHSDFGSKNKMEFPTGTPIDNITMSENLIKTAQRLLNTENILLTQSDAWAKAGTNKRKEEYNADQRIHMDYGNHTFLHPSKWEEPEAVAAIVYFSDVKDTGGETAIVPKLPTTEKFYKKPYLNMPGQKGIKFINDKDMAEEHLKIHHPKIYEFRKKLYENEIKITPEIGDVLFYRLDVWHRGTPVKIGKIRRVMNIAWKKSECTWINCWNPGFTIDMYYQKIETMFSNLSPLQRSVLGIPLPGDKYWTYENIFYLKERYQKLDVSPYLSKL